MWASNIKKLVAMTIDNLLIMLIVSLLKRSDSSFVLIYLIISFAYTTYFTTDERNTLGRFLMRVKILNQDGSLINFKTAALRSLCSLLSIFPLFLGYFIALFDEKKLTFHDRINQTKVCDY